MIIIMPTMSMQLRTLCMGHMDTWMQWALGVRGSNSSHDQLPYIWCGVTH
jgi:hypothetical protein